MPRFHLIPSGGSRSHDTHQVISSVDAFHVSQAVRAWRRAGEGAHAHGAAAAAAAGLGIEERIGGGGGGPAEVAARLLQAVELAGAHEVNKAVTLFLPAVVAAVLRLREEIAEEATALALASARVEADATDAARTAAAGAAASGGAKCGEGGGFGAWAGCGERKPTAATASPLKPVTPPARTQHAPWRKAAPRPKTLN